MCNSSQGYYQSTLADFKPESEFAIARFQLQAQIKSDWLKHSNVLNGCLLILDELLRGARWDLDNISFADLKSYCESNVDVARIIMYVTGARTHLLNLKMYFQDGDIRHKLNEDQMRSVNNGKFYHPISGELVTDSDDKVVIYFSASNQIKELRAKNSGLC